MRAGVGAGPTTTAKSREAGDGRAKGGCVLPEGRESSPGSRLLGGTKGPVWDVYVRRRVFDPVTMLIDPSITSYDYPKRDARRTMLSKGERARCSSREAGGGCP